MDRVSSAFYSALDDAHESLIGCDHVLNLSPVVTRHDETVLHHADE
jgi:hypothetical protein